MVLHETTLAVSTGDPGDPQLLFALFAEPTLTMRRESMSNVENEQAESVAMAFTAARSVPTIGKFAGNVMVNRLHLSTDVVFAKIPAGSMFGISRQLTLYRVSDRSGVAKPNRQSNGVGAGRR